MRKIPLLLLVSVLFSSAVWPTLARAQEETAGDSASQEEELDESAQEVNQEGAQPEGQKKVSQRLQSQFQVDEARVQSLRDKKLGYGEVAIVLSLAQQMSGGINDANVQKVMDLRQGEKKRGWGNVARELGVKLGPAVSGVERVKAEKPEKTRKPEKAEKPERREKPEKQAKSEKVEKPERSGKFERPEKPERPGQSKK